MENKKFTQIVALVDRETANRFRRMVTVYGLDRKEVLSEIVTNAIKIYNQKSLAEFEGPQGTEALKNED